LKYKSDGIRTEGQIRHFGRFILRAIRQLDVFASSACEIVSANINPSIADVVDVRKNGLIDNNLIAFARMSNGIDRAFGCGTNGRDANIYRVGAISRTCRELPLTGTGR
jgi:hypothetical protein